MQHEGSMCALSHNLVIHPKHVLSDTWNLLPKKESTCTMSNTGIAALLLCNTFQRRGRAQRERL